MEISEVVMLKSVQKMHLLSQYVTDTSEAWSVRVAAAEAIKECREGVPDEVFLMANNATRSMGDNALLVAETHLLLSDRVFDPDK